MKNLLLRSLSGAIYVALIVAAILINRWTFLALCLLFAILALIEFFKLSHVSTAKKSTATCIVDILGAIALITSTWCAVSFNIHTPFAAYLGYFLVRFIMQLYVQDKSPLVNLAYSMMGQLYIGFPLAMMSCIYAISPYLVLAMFIFIWLNDTGAFIVGSSIGRHPLFPRISPKKSWEGFWGGLVFCIATALLIMNLWPATFAPVKLSLMVAMSVVVSIFATWGDLVESMIKRTLHVKDSGTIMPGHGGILDRIDSLLCVSPAVLCYLLLILYL
ncbi:phosphatidate cytidylyltransferase [uncultured Muribaculum sp.]|uniref:phosphatidate cytidylyltransferase n=1 Tax=uncultured Muribaculum sp. TaxID=1918613 RepID=UPI00259C6B09|nr:phosphatidate cytidylyltransferase [uncultured Muribaculum sp.]